MPDLDFVGPYRAECDAIAERAGRLCHRRRRHPGPRRGFAIRGVACLGEAIVETTASLICTSDIHTGVISP
ncbi:hypothetical protein [Actinomycetospora callitridis]|uniref:hypothetical protein n=1 Tax=Actinomycetospora callitridis TaxID=913944 RepID=UPI0023673DCA|nr:hypothetical protein [Actinomycetospora callitridis]MDD7918260.1 hypothetical protein [Actinomycetospora callitridis]